MSWNRSSYIKYPQFKQLSGMTREQIDALVVRLNTSKPTDEHDDDKKKKTMSKPLSQEQLANMLERLANAVKNKDKTPESQRTGAGRVMGVVNTYAWKDGRLLKSRVTRPDGNWY